MRTKPGVLHILLLDDAPAGFELLSQRLVAPYANSIISWVRTVDDALSRLGTEIYDIVLIDNVLKNGETGFDLLTHPKLKACRVPAIFLTSYGDEYTAVRALKAGAYDYLVKERCDSSRLVYAISEALKEAHYKKQLEAHQIELVKLATVDDLTGLYNRRYFRTLLEAELERLARYNLPLSIALLDVDHFKRINDDYGHDTGDHVLKRLGKILREAVRSIDAVARYGGEEFIIAFPNTHLTGAEVLSERLRHAVESTFFYYEHMSIPVTVSVGVTEAYPETANADMLFKLADKALYAAKQDGRNLVVSYKYGVGL